MDCIKHLRFLISNPEVPKCTCKVHDVVKKAGFIMLKESDKCPLHGKYFKNKEKIKS
jgi:hypothetical protein